MTIAELQTIAKEFVESFQQQPQVILEVKITVPKRQEG